MTFIRRKWMLPQKLTDEQEQIRREKLRYECGRGEPPHDVDPKCLLHDAFGMLDTPGGYIYCPCMYTNTENSATKPAEK
jgi:hypothetical protein